MCFVSAAARGGGAVRISPIGTRVGAASSQKQNVARKEEVLYERKWDCAAGSMARWLDGHSLAVYNRIVFEVMNIIYYLFSWE